MAFASRTRLVSLANLSVRRTLAYKKGGYRGLRPKGFSSDDSPAESPQELDDTLRQFEDVVASESRGGKGVREHVQELKRQEQKSADFLKLKIIKAKYFRDEPELNILTWAAKEQIRYLHAEHPDEWTVEKLLATFPVSRYALNRILLSQQIADSIDEIEKHDRRVRQRWQLMLTSEKCKDEKLQRTLRSLVESGRICRIMNASGAKDSPYPPVRTLKKIAEEKPSPRGAFSLLFERCTQRVQDSACYPPRLIGSGQVDTPRKISHNPHEKGMTPRLAPPGRETSALIAPSASAMADVPHSSPAGAAANSRSAGAQQQDDDAVLAHLLNLWEPDFRRTKAHAAAEQLTYGKRASSVAPDNFDERPAAELYTYDPVKGYQTPFGKISSIPETIPVPERVKNSLRPSRSNLLIRKGNDFYASDGEYLYSVP